MDYQQILYQIGVFTSWLGILLLWLSQIIAIGVLLYAWGVQEISLGLAFWTAFKIWIGSIVTGFVLILLGTYLEWSMEKVNKT